MRKLLIPVALLLCLSAQSQPYARLEVVSPTSC